MGVGMEFFQRGQGILVGVDVGTGDLCNRDGNLWELHFQIRSKFLRLRLNSQFSEATNFICFFFCMKKH